MGITQEYYKKYYYGTSAELFIQSEIYAFGYEAYKAQPDIGYDICAHNSALVKFCQAPRQTFNIQVKAHLVNSNKINFWISPEDLELLASDDTGVFVGVLMKPNVGRMWNSFCYSNHRESSIIIDNSISDDAEQYQLSQDSKISFNNVDGKYNVVSYDRNYFWLSSNHINRLLCEGFFSETDYKGKKYKELTVILDNNSIAFQNSCGNQYFLSCEMKSIKYLLNPDVACKDDLNQGKLFESDVF